MKSKKITASLYIVCLLLLVACSPNVTPTPTSIPKTPSNSPSKTPVPDIRVTSSLSPISILTATPSATTTPTESPSPTPLPNIAIRNPSTDDVLAYLRSNGFSDFDEIAKILFSDVDGDGEEDAIAISDQAPVFVFRWQGDSYARPSSTGVWHEGLNHADGRFVYLKDYTDDGIPEIVNDTWWSRGDDTYIAVDWERQITYCDQTGCRVIWQDWFQSYGNAPISSGMFYYTSLDYVYQNNDQLILERRYTGFTFYWPYIGQDREPVLHPELNAAHLGWDTDKKFYQDVEVIRRYVWNGTAYEFLEDQILKEPELIAEDMLLETLAPSGEAITIKYFLDTSLQRVRGETYNNDRCQVFLGNTPISEPFGCKYNFTKITWENIIPGKGKQLVITTVAGDQSYIWPDLLVELGCFHRRIMVYEWEAGAITQVANFVGCIRGPDLFGVRVEDYDGDGQLEITAAPPWPQFLESEQPDGFSQDYLQINLLVEVYEWDGEKFVIGWALDN